MGFVESVRPSIPARLRVAAVSLVAASTVFVSAAAAAPAPTAAATGDNASRVIAIAESHLGAPWVFGATGPNAFDCSGLVYSVFRDAGLFGVIGNGSARTATQMWDYFAARGQASPYNGEPGDLVIFGNGAHIGIYVGSGVVISALVYGVAFSTLTNTIPGFTTFLHTHLSGTTASSPSYHHTLYWDNFRSGPATWYSIYSVLAPGTAVTILGTGRDGYGRTWDEVRLLNGSVGWVASWLIT